MKLVYSMTRKYLVSPMMEAARLSEGGHVMTAWEAKMSTFPTSPSVGGEEAVTFPRTPGKPPHGGGKIRGVGVWAEARWHIDFLYSIFVSPNMRLCFCPAHKPPTQCGYAGGIHKVKRALYVGGKLSAPAEHSNASGCLQLS